MGESDTGVVFGLVGAEEPIGGVCGRTKQPIPKKGLSELFHGFAQENSGWTARSV